MHDRRYLPEARLLHTASEALHTRSPAGVNTGNLRSSTQHTYLIDVHPLTDGFASLYQLVWQLALAFDLNPGPPTPPKLCIHACIHACIHGYSPGRLADAARAGRHKLLVGARCLAACLPACLR